MVFMVLESFRTYVRLDLVFGLEHVFKLTYPGDKKMGDSKQRWLDIIHGGIKPESVPHEEEVRDTLYEHMERDNPSKTQKYLLNMFERRVKANKEEKN